MSDPNIEIQLPDGIEDCHRLGCSGLRVTGYRTSGIDRFFAWSNIDECDCDKEGEEE